MDPDKEEDIAQPTGADPGEPAVDLWSSLGAFGISRELIRAELAPLVQEIVGESLNAIPDQVRAVIRGEIDQIAGRIVDQVKGAVVAPSGENGAGGPPGLLGGAGIGELLKFFAMMKGGGAGAANPTQNLSEMVSWTKAMGEVWRNMTEPGMAIYHQGRGDAYQSMGTFYKTGGELPWTDAQAPPPAGQGSRPANEGATLEQVKPTSSKEARAVASKIRLAP
jgi:hypothetical protein